MNWKKFLTLTTVLTVLCSAPALADDDDSSALESYNRAMFNFNSAADYYVIKPAAKGYRAITTEFIRERVHNFFANLK